MAHSIDTDREDSTKPVLRAGDTCWRISRADRFALVVDAADYFAAARTAMLKAKHTIVLIGWDFDLRISLQPDGISDGAPQQLGHFLKHVVKRNPDLRISILKWDMAVLFTIRNQLLPILALDLATSNNIRMRFDSSHPWTAAHHQKIVVIDDALAFCGGIDMTSERWDTREHRPGDERRKRPDGSLFGPWHDATAIVDGNAARALGEIANQRWHHATGERLDRPEFPRDDMDALWPDEIEPQFRNVDVGIARTMPEHREQPAIHEIEALYTAAIQSARRTIYLESQYFASVRICELIADRLREPDGPEVIVINPLSAEGWLEQQTMDTARNLRLRALTKADLHGRFGIFHPVNDAGEPIYVHAKILIVDDQFIRVGSSNVNNRSMGFDTECDLAIEAGSDKESATIKSIRNDLLAEHLGVRADNIEEAAGEHGSLLTAVQKLRRSSGRSLRPIPIRETNDTQEAVARSHLADPERAKHAERRIGHFAKSLLLRVPVAASLVVCAAGAALLLFAIT
ncbi:MAG: phospholipase D-like domain-containing protein [Rhodomicrobiaceae bacterium]